MTSADGYTTEVLVKAFSISMCILKSVVATPCPIERIIDHYRNLSHLNEIPPFHYRGSPTEVRISIFVQSVSAVNEVDMDYTIDIYLRQRWEDPRLAFDLCDNDIYLNSNWLKKIWLPDIFFVNSKSEVFHDVTVPNIALRISPNGAIFFSQRLSINLGCVMELFKFPLDVQNCETQLLSYSYRIEELVVKWMDESEPVQLDPGIRLPQTDIHATEHGACLLAYDGSTYGNYSCIFTRFKLQRLNGFYVIQIYVPGILIVMLSWVSFWLDPRATPARVSLGLLCVLTTTTHTTGINSSLPRVSYVKAMDVWNFTCLLFVFGALLEFAVINVKTRKEESHGRNLHIHKTSRSISKPSPWIISCLPSAPEVTSAMPRVTRVCHWTAEKVDKTCRVLFPLAFLIFNIIYWTYYKLSPTYSNASAFSGQQQDLL